MPSETELDRAEETSREQPDLCQQYRPIGIGAVAAALAAGGRSAERENRPRGAANSAANSNERIGRSEPLAA